MNKLFTFSAKKTRFITLLLFAGILLFSTQVFAAGNATKGKALFNAHCSSCHNPGTATLIGPGLHGILQRQSRDWVHHWVKNSQAFIKTGDGDAQAIFDKFKIVMPPQPVTDAQIDDILAFIQNPPKAPSGGGAATTTQKTSKPKPQHTPTYLIFVFVAILFIFVIILKNTYYSLKRAKEEKEGKPVEKEPTVWGGIKKVLKKNKGVVAVVVVVIIIWLCKILWDALFGIGVYQGYAPKQPIAFSHKVHAGIEKIDCQYCHSAAHNGRTSGIPSANVCMNCHKYIHKSKYEPQPGEIAKIYKAIGFDPRTGKYIKNYKRKPIKWVKVHNLPDFVYFNHSQHVVVGKIKCQKCHGPVEKMAVMKQYAPLTMGWCIHCHINTKVQMKGNGYYDEVHARLPKTLLKQFMKDGKITVSELGGIECGKCHY